MVMVRKRPEGASRASIAPTAAKSEMKRLSEVINRKYGKEGKEELTKLFEAYQPNSLFKKGDTPALRNKLAAFINDLSALNSELAEADFFRKQEARVVAEAERAEGEEADRRGEASAKRKRSKGPAKKKKPVVAKSSGDPFGTVKGKYDGFSYKVIPQRNGEWEIKPTMRKLVHVPGAPDPYKFKRTHIRLSDAEAAFRDSIRQARFWYDERGETMRFAPSKTEKGRAFLKGRKSPTYRSTRKEERKDEAALAEKERRKKKRILEQRELRKKREKQKSKQRRASEPEKQRKLIRYVPKGNPSKPFSFSHSESGALKSAGKAYDKYEDAFATFRDTKASGKMDFRSLMRAYDNIENSRANFFLAGDEENSERANDIKRGLRNEIIDSFKFCQDMMLGKRRRPAGLGPTSNPTKAVHQKLGLKHFEKAEACWKKYCEKCGITDLLNAYKHMEIAREELKNAGDKDGCKRASELAKLARSEIKKRTKGK